MVLKNPKVGDKYIKKKKVVFSQIAWTYSQEFEL